MKISGKLLFAGAAMVSIFIAYKMFTYAIVTTLVCVLLVEIAEIIRKRMEKNKLTCNECFHFMRNDLHTKPKNIGFCCHKQTTLNNCKTCSHFSAKVQKNA
jgi:hypothetical protein